MPEFSKPRSGARRAAAADCERQPCPDQSLVARRSRRQSIHLYACALPGRGGTCDCGAQASAPE